MSWQIRLAVCQENFSGKPSHLQGWYVSAMAWSYQQARQRWGHIGWWLLVLQGPLCRCRSTNAPQTSQSALKQNFMIQESVKLDFPVIGSQHGVKLTASAENQYWCTACDSQACCAYALHQCDMSMCGLRKTVVLATQHVLITARGMTAKESHHTAFASDGFMLFVMKAAAKGKWPMIGVCSGKAAGIAIANMSERICLSTSRKAFVKQSTESSSQPCELFSTVSIRAFQVSSMLSFPRSWDMEHSTCETDKTHIDPMQNNP